MRTDDFDFDLPSDLIALRPMVPREAGRLLVIQRHLGIVAEATINDLPRFLRSGDAVVLNDTKVIPCALVGVRRRGQNVVPFTMTLIRRATASAWWAFVKPGRRFAPGDQLQFKSPDGDVDLSASVMGKSESGEILIGFDRAGDLLDSTIAGIGNMPLPPYIASRRAADMQDRHDYQTVYAKRDGSVAAPTAGLHLTDSMLGVIRDIGVAIETITLHVGAGTFLPVKSDLVTDHRMHHEWGEVGEATIHRLNALRAKTGHVIAIGTTSARVLESATIANGELAAFDGETDIFITPGYRFRAIDGLLTNFHLPRSTLFMLVCAFAGVEVMREAYAHAISHRYRFFSYGDACLLLPEG